MPKDELREFILTHLSEAVVRARENSWEGVKQHLNIALSAIAVVEAREEVIE